MAPQMSAARAGSASSEFDRRGDAESDLVERLVPLVGVDAVFRDEDVLWGSAHLARIERQREGEVRAHGGKGVGTGDHDRVDPGFLGIDPRLAGVRPHPGAERVGASVVDDGDGGMTDES